jgi:hypothetical protein
MNGIRFRGLFFLRYFLLIGVSLSNSQAQKKLDIFLLIGQSNMAGRGPMLPGDSSEIPGVYVFKDSANWEVASNPLNKYSTIRKDLVLQQIGPGFGFAKEIRRRLPKQEFGLVVNARGGTALEEWVKGTLYYTEAIKRTKQAMKSGTLKGILWHQGESNSSDTNYVSKLSFLIDSLRKDLGMPNLPFMGGQLGIWDQSRTNFNALILDLPKRVHHTAVIRSDSLKDIGDATHFDRSSQIILGTRYADQVWTLVYHNGTTILEKQKTQYHTAPRRGINSRPCSSINGLDQRNLLGKQTHSTPKAGMIIPYLVEPSVPDF